MQVFWFFAICCLTVAAVEFDDKDARINGENGWYVPRLDGSFEWMNMEKFKTKTLGIISEKIKTVRFYLYTRSNPDNGQLISASNSIIENSNYNASWPTVFVVHGFLQSHIAKSINHDLCEAYLQNGNYNFIFVEWIEAVTLNYFDALRAVPKVGKHSAELIDFLRKKFGNLLNSIHLVGHSLGAHVCGHAAKNVETGPIEKIIGLDPAGPGFSIENTEERLNSKDAKLVVSLETDGGFYGLDYPIGNVTYCFNGGKHQEGCPTNFCSHERSVIYYCEIIKGNKKFAAVKCPNYKSAIAKDCGEQTTWVTMDEENKSVESGVMLVLTSDKSPFVTFASN